MINEKDYKIGGGVSYITYQQVLDNHSDKEVRSFDNYFVGQTGMLINGEYGIYTWDYERWIEGGMPDKQGRSWD